MSFEDILFLKSELHDERIAFQHELARVQQKALEIGITESELQSFMHANITSPMQDLEEKVKGLKKATLRKFIKNIQNPAAYVPLIGTFASNLPLQVTAALSAGLITTETFMDFIDEKKSIQKNSLNFLLKLKS